MSIRDYRTGRVRRGNSDKVKRTRTHDTKKSYKREDDRTAIEEVLAEWAEDYEGNYDIFA